MKLILFFFNYDNSRTFLQIYRNLLHYIEGSVNKKKGQVEGKDMIINILSKIILTEPEWMNILSCVFNLPSLRLIDELTTLMDLKGLANSK